MRVIVILLLLAASVDASLTYARTPLFMEGGVAAGPPVYDYWIRCSRLNATILSPANGTVFYMPSITPNVTFYLYGATLPTCRYRTTGNWTTFNCSDGNNTQAITLPEGWPTPLTFEATAGQCSATHTVNTYVSYGRGAKNSSQAILLPIVLILALIFLDDEQPKRKKPRQ